jgi:hypothetical protein
MCGPECELVLWLFEIRIEASPKNLSIKRLIAGIWELKMKQTSFILQPVTRILFVSEGLAQRLMFALKFDEGQETSLFADPSGFGQDGNRRLSGGIVPENRSHGEAFLFSILCGFLPSLVRLVRR